MDPEDGSNLLTLLARVMVVVVRGTLVQRLPLTVVKGLGGVAIHAGSRCTQLEGTCAHGEQQQENQERGGLEEMGL